MALTRADRERLFREAIPAHTRIDLPTEAPMNHALTRSTLPAPGQSILGLERLVDRHGPSTPAVAIVPTQPGIAGDVIDPLAMAALLQERYPDEAEDVRQAVGQLLRAYRDLIDA